MEDVLLERPVLMKLALQPEGRAKLTFTPFAVSLPLLVIFTDSGRLLLPWVTLELYTVISVKRKGPPALVIM